MQPVYIVSAVRTPIGKFGGSLAELAAADKAETLEQLKILEDF